MSPDTPSLAGSEQPAPGRQLDVFVRAALIAALAVLCYRLFSPFLPLMVWAVIVAVTCVIGIGVFISSGPQRNPGAFPADAQPEASTQSGRTHEHNVSADPEAPGHRF